MRISEADERDSSWEDDSPVLRVYVFRRDTSLASWTTWTYDLTETDVLEAVQWAQGRAGDDGLYALALVSHRSSAPNEPAKGGLIWLVGADANSRPRSVREVTLHERMHELSGKRITIG